MNNLNIPDLHFCCVHTYTASLLFLPEAIGFSLVRKCPSLLLLLFSISRHSRSYTYWLDINVVHLYVNRHLGTFEAEGRHLAHYL